MIWQLILTSKVSLAAVNLICPSNYFKSNHFPEMTTRPTKLALTTRGITTSTAGWTPIGGSIWNITTSYWGRGNERKTRSGTSGAIALPGFHLWNKTAVSFYLQWKSVKTMIQPPLLFILEHLWISAKRDRHNWYFTGQHELWGMHTASFTYTVVKHSDRTTYALTLIQYDKPHEEITPKGPPPRHTHIYLHSYTDIRSTLFILPVHFLKQTLGGSVSKQRHTHADFPEHFALQIFGGHLLIVVSFDG